MDKGYQRINLHHKGNARKFTIHRLVAIAFIDNPQSKPQVNHIDGNKLNNNASNLEWNTAKENTNHADSTGLRRIKGESNYNVRISDTQVYELRELYKTGDYSQRKLSKLFGISQCSVWRIIHKKARI